MLPSLGAQPVSGAPIGNLLESPPLGHGEPPKREENTGPLPFTLHSLHVQPKSTKNSGPSLHLLQATEG